MITAEIIDNVAYYTTVRGGVEYTAYQSAIGGWYVLTKRLALGRSNVGGCKHFDSVNAVASSVKAFFGLNQLVA